MILFTNAIRAVLRDTHFVLFGTLFSFRYVRLFLLWDIRDVAVVISPCLAYVAAAFFSPPVLFFSFLLFILVF